MSRYRAYIEIEIVSVWDRRQRYVDVLNKHSDLPEPSMHNAQAVKSPLKVTDDNPIAPEPTNKSNYQSKTAYPGMLKSNKELQQKQQQTEQEQTNNNKTLDTHHWFQHLEEITVTVAPEREGFIFKHVNYIVTNEKRSSIVLRRYSDFWWLLEVLQRRYPFRALPNLPPKKLGGSK